MISSLCTIANHRAAKELAILVKSFRLFHPDIPIYVGADNATVSVAGELDCHGVGIIGDELDCEQNCPKWLTLMLKKTEIMDMALARNPDTLFVDADVIFLNPITGIKIDIEVALSPHYINARDEKQYGRYNGGYVWTSKKSFPGWWRDNTPRSKYYEQQTLVFAAEAFTVQELSAHHNYSWWRIDQIDKRERERRLAAFDAVPGTPSYEGRPLVSVHTHIFSRDKKFASINNLTRKLLRKTESRPESRAILALIGKE